MDIESRADRGWGWRLAGGAGGAVGGRAVESVKGREFMREYWQIITWKTYLSGR